MDPIFHILLLNQEIDISVLFLDSFILDSHLHDLGQLLLLLQVKVGDLNDYNIRDKSVFKIN